eukprot:GFYU01003160.1.p1 GENE.GFYU01003160.1~~GFYU01003160.1.p1  ORF type:complete len:354 (+),score=90.09 GFYU01003160.1:60-1121(+)
MTISVNIKTNTGGKFTVQTEVNITVAEFKVIVAGSCDIPKEQQRLIYKGQVLKDHQTLESYGLETDHTVHLVKGLAPGQQPGQPAATPAGAAPGVPGATPGAAPGANPFNPWGGMGGMGGMMGNMGGMMSMVGGMGGMDGLMQSIKAESERHAAAQAKEKETESAKAAPSHTAPAPAPPTTAVPVTSTAPVAVTSPVVVPPPIAVATPATQVTQAARAAPTPTRSVPSVDVMALRMDAEDKYIEVAVVDMADPSAGALKPFLVVVHKRDSLASLYRLVRLELSQSLASPPRFTLATSPELQRTSLLPSCDGVTVRETLSGERISLPYELGTITTTTIYMHRGGLTELQVIRGP